MLSRCSGTGRRLVVLVAMSGAGLALVAAAPPGSATAGAAQCQGRPVTIEATFGDSTVRGTEGSDVIDGAGRSDLMIVGLGGDDAICSGSGTRVTIDGGDGDDRIEMTTGIDDAASHAADGGAGDDELVFVGEGHGQGRGGEGDDRLVDATTYYASSITMSPGPGDDIVVGRDNRSRLLFGGTTGVRISARDGRADGEGHDTFSGIYDFVGTVASDTFVGSERNDSFLGGARTPRLVPIGAPDLAYGGGGSDLLLLAGRAEGGEGPDRLWVYGPTAAAWGGPGLDSLRLFPGGGCTSSCRLRADGGAGVDRVIVRPAGRHGVRIDLTSGRASMGASGRVSLEGVENAAGTPFRDVLIGNARPNLLRGHSGRDVVEGRGGADRLLGDYGRDVLVGGRGRDRANGGRDRDRCEAEVRRSC